MTDIGAMELVEIGRSHEVKAVQLARLVLVAGLAEVADGDWTQFSSSCENTRERRTHP